MSILDKLMEKKDLNIYLDNRVQHLKEEKKALPDKISEPTKREPAIRQVEGRIKELERLRQIIEEDDLKNESKHMWELANE